MTKTLETKPQLVQISSAWNTREGAPLGRNRYVELELKKVKTNGTGSKTAPYQRPLREDDEAIVADGVYAVSAADGAGTGRGTKTS